MGTQTVFCLPTQGIVNSQAVRIVARYLREHPAELHYQARTVASLALAEAFPCPWHQDSP
jgi:hypothetical protein